MNGVRFAAGGVSGFLHEPQMPAGGGLVLTHGAGGNCRSPLLVTAAEAFAEAGLCVLRCDLPFRQRRATGPPAPGDAARDREGLEAALTAMRRLAPGTPFLGGASYGGRQATMLAAEAPEAASGLLLFSYPLHPPGKPQQPRVAHFPRLLVAAVFVQGSRDPFGTLDELRAAIAAIPAPTRILPIDNAGHDLKRGRFDFAPVVESLLGR